MNEIRLLDLKETAEILNIKPATVMTFIRKGKLKAKKLTNKWFILDAEIERFIKDIHQTMLS